MSELNPSSLLATVPPWFFRVAGSHSDVTDLVWSFQLRHLPLGAFRWLRGTEMTTTYDVFREFQAALQFPYYFGAGWNGFDECIRDLDWISAAGYIILILDSADLLANEEESQLDRLLLALEWAAVEWSKPIALGEAWDRPAVPFHVLFHYLPEDEQRLHRRIASIPDTLPAVLSRPQTPA